MDELKQSDDNHFIPMTTISAGKGREVRPDVYYFTNQIVNVIFVGAPSGPWVLVDAGMPESGAKILAHAQERFGNRPPEAIILTHGHFDHVGGIVHLLEKWQGIKVYAHPAEHPYLTGQSAYPEPDPGVEGGGLLAKIAKIYPHEPINITRVLDILPADHSVPFMKGWQWIHTPGHAPGHVSLYRESDKILIAGDAFVTVRQDSLYKVLIQQEEVSGPPSYFTIQWSDARESVRTLANFDIDLAITGHGTFMQGDALRNGLNHLSQHFDEVALPDYGKYVRESDKE